MTAQRVNSARLRSNFEEAATRLFTVYDNPQLQEKLQAAKEHLPVQELLAFADQVEFREAAIAPLLPLVYAATEKDWNPPARSALRQLFHLVVHTKLDENADAPAPFPHFANFRIVLPGKLYAGSEPTHEGLSWVIETHDINTIVSLRSETPRGIDLSSYPQVQHFQILITDGGIPKFEQGREFLGIVNTPGNAVFVHCNAGIGRTGVAVAIAEIAAGARGVEEAVQNALQYRVRATLTSGQQEFIRDFARRELG